MTEADWLVTMGWLLLAVVVVFAALTPGGEEP